MKKILKSTIAIILIISICFTFTSCGNKQTPEYNFENPLADKTYSEVVASAEEISKDKVYTLDDNSTFEITSVKDKKIVVSSSGVIISVVTFVIAMIIGGIFTSPAMYYSSDKSMKTIEVELEYTNNSNENVMIGDIVHVAFASANDELFTGVVCHPGFNKLDYTCSEVVEAGETEKFSILIDVPKDYLKNGDIFNLYFDINGDVYTASYVK